MVSKDIENTIQCVQDVFSIIRKNNITNYFDLLEELKEKRPDLLFYTIGEFTQTVTEYMKALTETTNPKVVEEREQRKSQLEREYIQKYGHFPSAAEVRKF